ncbi:MAG: alpha/beta hydrolase [Desulfobacteraceae bacterium]|nr:alpha/beta hydrolase [Desulfobacteraceae bacterium]
MRLDLNIGIIILSFSIFATSCSFSTQNLPNTTISIPSLPKIPGSMEHVVVDPVSKGETYIYEAGMGNPVSILLIHGVGDEGSLNWRHLIPELAEQYHVVTFDLPGFGRSSKQNILYSPLFYSKFIKWVKDHYIRDRQFIIIGHSLGGAVALSYAATQPDNLQRLILADVSGVIHRMGLTQHIMKNMHKKNEDLLKYPTKLFGMFASHTLDAMESPDLSTKLEKVLESADLRSRYLSGDPHKIASLALANFDFSKLIYQVNVPAIIIWGANDPTTPIRTGKMLNYILEKTQLNIMPETGHNPILESPREFNRLVQDALVTQTWQAPVQKLQKTDRVAVLSNKQNITLTGYYKSIEISDCKNIRLENLETEFIQVIDSDDIVIENSKVIGNDVALHTRESRIKLTGVQLSAETTIITFGSVIDLAGGKITGKKAAIKAINGSRLIFSICKIESPFNNGYIHGYYAVEPENPL